MKRRLCPYCEREAVKLCLYLFGYGCLVGYAVASTIYDKVN